MQNKPITAFVEKSISIDNTYRGRYFKIINQLKNNEDK